MQMHLSGGLSGPDRLWSDTSADRRTVHVRVGQAVLLGCLKVGAGICLAVTLRLALRSVSERALPLSRAPPTDTQDHDIALRDRVPLES